MNKTAIKNFAIWARNKLIADICYRAGLMGITEKGIADPLPQSTLDAQFYDIGTAEPYLVAGEAIKQRRQLVSAIREKEADTDYATAYQYIMEEVAYTWFNRLIAVRFMEVNDYLPSHLRVLSSESGKVEPDLVTTPFDAELPFTAEEEAQIIQWKRDNKLDELFRFLFIKQCNALNEILPGLFEKTTDYTEVLLNLSVVDQEGVVYKLTHDIPEKDFNIEQVYKKGVLMVDHGEIQDFPSPEIEPYLVERAHKTFHVAALTAEDFETMTTAFFPPTEHQMGELSGIKFWPSVCSFYGECNQTKIQMYNQAAAEEAGAEFHFATTAEYIIMQDGAVAGLVASDADGYIKINCKAVVCACGGMGGNPEMMAYFMPDMAQARTGEDPLTSMSANDGRGVQMAYWAGAHLETTPVAGMNMKGLSVPGKMNCLPQAVWIDENGRRFANEYYPTSEQRGYQTVFMSRKTKYAVVDNNFTEYRQYTLPQHAGFTANEENIASLRDSLDKAYAKFKGTYEEPEQEEGQGGPGGGGPMTQVEWIADDTLEGLAGQMGLSGDAATEFVAQIERWNGYCEAGVDEEFGRAAEVLFPVKDGPFYACTFDPVLGETMVTMGGIITDGEQNALDANYEPIPGLYMAGNDCGRRFGTEYVTPIPGCSLAFALVLGRECGKSVAKFLG